MSTFSSGLLPWTKSCFVCGEENPRGWRLRARAEEGRVVLSYAARPEDVGYRGVVHGGLLITLVDEAMTWAAILALRKMCVAAELSIRLRRPVAPGEVLRVEGWVTRAAARLALAAGVVRAAEGHPCLEAQGKYVPMPAERAAAAAQDFVWSTESLGPDAILGGIFPA